MILRNLGKSGLRVSLVGLGCNNFGQRMDLESSQAVIHKALDCGITLFDTADVYGGRGGSETVLGRGAGRAPQGHRACLEIRHADGRCREEGRVAPLHRGGRGGEPEAAENRLDRPLSAAPPRPAYPDRRDAARTRRPREGGQGALYRQFEFHRRPDGRGGADRTAAQSCCLRLLPGRILAAQARP